jgi:hypothetical protein
MDHSCTIYRFKCPAVRLSARRRGDISGGIWDVKVTAVVRFDWIVRVKVIP